MSLKILFLKGFQEEIHERGYSIRTEQTYLYWIKAFINFHHKRHPVKMGTEKVWALSKLTITTKIGTSKAKKLVAHHTAESKWGKRKLAL